ncbi:MAG: hypothetical protein R3E13_11180 [Alphaproteobacteria bacterium]
MSGETQTVQDAAALSSDILKSSAFYHVWDQFYRSRTGDKNPVHDVARRVDSWKNGDAETSQEQAELTAFLREALHIQLKALGPYKENESPEHTALRRQLDHAGGVLYVSLPPEKNLGRQQIENKDLKKILDVMEQHFAQDDIDPIRTAKEFFSEAGGFVLGKIKENPKKAAVAFMAYGALTAFMTVRLPRTDMMDEISAGIRDFEIDDEGNVINVEWEQPTLADLEGMNLPFHGELQSLFPEFAETIRESEFLSNLMPHYTKVKDLSLRANELANDGTEWLRNYTYDIGVTDVANLPTEIDVLVDTAWMDGYKRASPYVADFWYSYNFLENIILHPAYAATGFAAVVAGAYLNRENLTNAFNTASDFFHRAFSAKLLPYGSSLAAMGTDLAANNFDPGVSMIWMGIGGGLLGRSAHKLYRHFAEKNKESVLEMTQEVKTSLAAFNDLASSEPLTALPPLEEKSTLWRNFVYANLGAVGASAVFAGMDTAGLPELISNQSIRDIFDYASFASGAAASVQGTTLAFVHYNVPDEIIQHRVWGGAGIIAGTMVLPFILAGRKAKSLLDMFSSKATVGAAICGGVMSFNPMKQNPELFNRRVVSPVAVVRNQECIRKPEVVW